MIILRTRQFSSRNGNMIEDITKQLDKIGVEDYEVAVKIPLDTISVIADPRHVKIYIPRDFEYSQYDIDDFVRSILSHARTKTVYDRNIYVMTVSTPMNLSQYCKLIKYIADEWEFCTIIEN